MTPEQSRAARAVTGLTVADAAAAIGAGVSTIVAFEKGRDVRLSSLKRLQEFYEGKGFSLPGTARASFGHVSLRPVLDSINNPSQCNLAVRGMLSLTGRSLRAALSIYGIFSYSGRP